MTTIQFIIDKQRDAKNRFTSANGSNYGVNWSRNMNQEIVGQIVGKDRDIAEETIIKHIDKLYDIYNFPGIIENLNVRRSIMKFLQGWKQLSENLYR